MGTETASVWNGYMEGAVRSGERVAAEVVARQQPGDGAHYPERTHTLAPPSGVFPTGL